MVGFGEAIKRGFAGYATFAGRSTRAEYWWWVLFYALAMTLAYVPMIATIENNADGTASISGVGIAIAAIVYLALLLPTLAVTVRRLHDTSRSGWWWWIGLICGVWLFILMLLPSTEGQNQYG